MERIWLLMAVELCFERFLRAIKALFNRKTTMVKSVSRIMSMEMSSKIDRRLNLRHDNVVEQVEAKFSPNDKTLS